MASTLFITGATGYIGGVVIHHLSAHLPQLSIKALVRSAAKGDKLKSTYPNVSYIVGVLEDSDLLISEASRADIVIECANIDHPTSPDALLEGVRRHPGSIFVVVSGFGSLLDLENSVPGAAPTKHYSDVDDIEEIMALPEKRFHVPIERRIMKTSDDEGIKSVILAPPIIFHSGAGIGEKQSFPHHTPRAFIEYGKPFVVNQGEGYESWIAVDDIAETIIFLIEEAQKEQPRIGFGSKGYFYIDAGEVSIKEQVEVVADELKKLGAIKSTEVEHITVEQASKWGQWAVLVWTAMAVSKADRLRQLGWKPKITDWRPLARGMTRGVFEKEQAK